MIVVKNCLKKTTIGDKTVGLISSNGVTSENKTTFFPSSPPLCWKLGWLLFLIGSSKRGTTLHGGGGGGREGKFHSSLEVGKTSERPLGQIVSLNFVAYCSLPQGVDVVHHHKVYSFKPPLKATSLQRPLFWTGSPYIDSCLNLSTTATFFCPHGAMFRNKMHFFVARFTVALIQLSAHLVSRV